MASRVKDVAGSLSRSDREALETLERGGGAARLGGAAAERLLGLGLVELSLGELDLTAAGRHVLRLMHERTVGR